MIISTPTYEIVAKAECGGVVVAVQPTLATSDYRCQECGQQHSADTVTGLEEELAEMLHMTSKHDMGTRKNISNYREKYLRNVWVYFY